MISVDRYVNSRRIVVRILASVSTSMADVTSSIKITVDIYRLLWWLFIGKGFIAINEHHRL